MKWIRTEANRFAFVHEDDKTIEIEQWRDMQQFIVERMSAQYSYMKDEDHKKTDNSQGEGVEGENFQCDAWHPECWESSEIREMEKGSMIWHDHLAWLINGETLV